MPLTPSGQRVLSSMQSSYGGEKGERVFYASINKGKPGTQKWHGASRSTSPTTPSAPRSLSKR